MAGYLKSRRTFHAGKVALFFAGAAILAGLACAGPAFRQREQLHSPGMGSSEGQEELERGIELTRHGRFAEAIPLFLAARGKVADEYALEFNLALCYVGTRQAGGAIPVLEKLRDRGHDTAAVENLLAQAFVANRQNEQAWKAVERAARLAPGDEKMYAFVADAAAEQRGFDFGLRVAALGLQHLPGSARLHYQKGHFLARLDRLDEGGKEFDLCRKLAPDTEIAVLAETEKNFYGGNLPATIEIARKAAREGRANELVLAILGDALLRAGAAPGDPQFSEAEAALRESLERRPGNPSALVSLGYLLLVAGRLEEARTRLEKGRELDPANPATYRHLSALYRKQGDPQRAGEMLAMLAKLNADEAARISLAPGERKPVP